MEGVLAAFAQFDNDIRSDRTRAGTRTALDWDRGPSLPPVVVCFDIPALCAASRDSTFEVTPV